jgi:hypothetical protein
VSIDDLFQPRDIERFSNLVDQGTHSVDRSPGVYVFSAGELFERRAGASDILYIGSAGHRSLRERINDYVREAKRYPNPVYRPGAERLIAEFFAESDDLVLLGWWAEASKEDAKESEDELLRLFVRDHGERPPFNLRGGGRVSGSAFDRL